MERTVRCPVLLVACHADISALDVVQFSMMPKHYREIYVCALEAPEARAE